MTDTETRAGFMERRTFFRDLGFGAFGASLLGPSMVFGAERDSLADTIEDDAEDDLEASSACTIALWSTGRIAFSQAIGVGACTPCNCPSRGQLNWKLKEKFVTTFNFDGSDCDELAQVGIPPQGARLSWNLKRMLVRQNGPCQSPVGSYTGKVLLLIANNTVMKGNVTGTLGYDPSKGGSACCEFPLVVGAINAKGISGTPLQGCKAQWVYRGTQAYASPPDICDPQAWRVQISGLLACKCPP